jgi:hypothetical protein
MPMTISIAFCACTLVGAEGKSPTVSKDVAPILQMHCHLPGEIHRRRAENNLKRR